MLLSMTAEHCHIVALIHVTLPCVYAFINMSLKSLWATLLQCSTFITFMSFLYYHNFFFFGISFWRETTHYKLRTHYTSPICRVRRLGSFYDSLGAFDHWWRSLHFHYAFMRLNHMQYLR